MKFSALNSKVDWGVCDGCGKKNMLLAPWVHRPTGGLVFLCAVCTENAGFALEKGQVPGMLESKLQEWVLEVR